MSRFFSSKLASLTPYTPGEQPKDMQYIKLNTNESPFPPSAGVIEAVTDQGSRLQLYSDPECTAIRSALAKQYGLSTSQVIATNGSDEVLNFAFMAFCDDTHPIAFADITYGFYPVFAQLHRIPYQEIPLKEDFTLDYHDYCSLHKNIVIANPNAPTGLALPLWQIEEILRSNPDHVVIIDEAYVDFGAESAVSLLSKYDNLLVTGTFSKSRSLAGARLGFGFGSPALISDLHTIRYSTNPYNVNRMTEFAGVAALGEQAYYDANAQEIIRVRGEVKTALEHLGFTVLDSKTNFLFAKSDRIGGEELYLALKKRGVLIRHFSKSRIKDYNRITVGTQAQMEAFLAAVSQILTQKGSNL